MRAAALAWPQASGSIALTSCQCLRTLGVVAMSAALVNLDPTYERPTGRWAMQLPMGEQIQQTPMPEGHAEIISHRIPPLTSGQRLELSEGTTDECDVGGKIWRGAGALCRWQRTITRQMQGASVLELGAGTGASGLYAAGLGASRVVLTDGGPPQLFELLSSNVECNRHLFGSAEVRAEYFRFGGATMPEGPFDLVLASDVTYSVHEVRDALCKTIRSFLESGSRCVVAHEHRRATMFDLDTTRQNRERLAWDQDDVALRMFLEAAEENGLAVQPIRSEMGWREQKDDIVYMTTDLTVMEIHLDPSWVRV